MKIDGVIGIEPGAAAQADWRSLAAPPGILHAAVYLGTVVDAEVVGSSPGLNGDEVVLQPGVPDPRQLERRGPRTLPKGRAGAQRMRNAERAADHGIIIANRVV